MKNMFTVDLEEWFCSHNLKNIFSYEDWDKLESRIEHTTTLLLDVLSRNKTSATFFVLGWVAERYPDLIKIIQNEGHEIASHGYAHRQITCQTPHAFEADIAQSNGVLRQITGVNPAGYRAPAFSITKTTAWALPLLKRHGFRYDSSIYPVSSHPDYGFKSMPLHMHARDGLMLVPMSCATYHDFRLPCSGGGYLRFYPFPIFKHLVRRSIQQGRPFVFYIHPWEADSNPPALKRKFPASFRHNYNTNTTLEKIKALLNEFEFTSIAQILRV